MPASAKHARREEKRSHFHIVFPGFPEEAEQNCFSPDCWRKRGRPRSSNLINIYQNFKKKLRRFFFFFVFPTVIFQKSLQPFKLWKTHTITEWASRMESASFLQEEDRSPSRAFGGPLGPVIRGTDPPPSRLRSAISAFSSSGAEIQARGSSNIPNRSEKAGNAEQSCSLVQIKFCRINLPFCFPRVLLPPRRRGAGRRAAFASAAAISINK